MSAAIVMKRKSRFSASCATLGIALALLGCSAASTEKLSPRERLIGSWETVDDDGRRYALTFLPGGEFAVHLVYFRGPFETSPSPMTSGRWSVEGDRIFLVELKTEQGLFPSPESDDVEFEFDGVRLVVGLPDDPDHFVANRINWLPEPIPADAIPRRYFGTIDGTCVVEVVPERTEGRPGDRIPVRVTLTNTGSVPFYAPVRLSDRIYLRDDYLDLSEDIIRLNIDFDDVPFETFELTSMLLKPGERVGFAATYILRNEPGRYRIRPVVLENPEAELKSAEVRVLPATNAR